MKKLMYSLLALGLSVAQVQAACVLGGAFCADDTGTSVRGVLQDGNGSGLPLLTQANVTAATPKAKGQEIFCTNCTNFATGLGFTCISTGTTRGAYMAISSATAVTACQ